MKAMCFPPKYPPKKTTIGVKEHKGTETSWTEKIH